MRIKTYGLALAFAALNIALLAAFFISDSFFEWAFARHANTLSWWVRPLALLPIGYFAWRRSLSGVLASVFVLLSSMFWFPAPKHPDPQVLEFLEMEKDLLSSGWNIANVLGALAVAIYGSGLVAAIWHRSVVLSLTVILLGGMLKILWSFIFSPEAGGSIAPMAILGTGCVVLIVWYMAKGRFGKIH